MHSRKSDNISSFEKQFQTERMLKRNARYHQQPSSVRERGKSSRKRPHTSGGSTLDRKISQSFVDTTAIIDNKVEEEISKFRGRVTTSMKSLANTGLGDTSISSSVQNSPRKNSLSKNLGREYYSSLLFKQCHDQRQFLNFSLEKPELSHTSDLGKSTERKLDFAHKNITDLQYETQKLYEQHYYKRLNMECIFDYSKGTRGNRVFFNPRRDVHEPKNIPDPQAVDVARRKVAVEPSRITHPFFMDSGRQLPCQNDQRKTTPLTDHWRGADGLIHRFKADYSQRKKRIELEERRKEAVKQRHQRNIARGEICEQRYFREMP